MILHFNFADFDSAQSAAFVTEIGLMILSKPTKRETGPLPEFRKNIECGILNNGSFAELMKSAAPEIKNKKAAFEFSFLQTYTAGIMLTGTEVKSIRAGKANFTDSYCVMMNGDLFLKNMHISEYKEGSYNNHEPKRIRKLLLNKEELRKMESKLKEKGTTVVPVRLFFNERGIAKLEIAVARGKKFFDKRESLKEKDLRRQMSRQE